MKNNFYYKLPDELRGEQTFCKLTKCYSSVCVKHCGGTDFAFTANPSST